MGLQQDGPGELRFFFCFSVVYPPLNAFNLALQKQINFLLWPKGVLSLLIPCGIPRRSSVFLSGSRILNFQASCHFFSFPRSHPKESHGKTWIVSAYFNLIFINQGNRLERVSRAWWTGPFIRAKHRFIWINKCILCAWKTYRFNLLINPSFINEQLIDCLLRDCFELICSRKQIKYYFLACKVTRNKTSLIWFFSFLFSAIIVRVKNNVVVNPSIGDYFRGDRLLDLQIRRKNEPRCS